MTPDGGLDQEFYRLRDWRHNVVTPELAAHGALLKWLQSRVDELEPRVAAMAKADEIANAVAEHMQASRRGLLSTGEKLGGLAVGLAAVVSVILQFLH